MPDAEPSRRARLDAALRPYALGTHATDGGHSLTERRIAEVARDAAESVLPLLGPPARSADQVRTLLRAVLTCSWSDFEAIYETTLTTLLALPPAHTDAEEPSWDAALAPAPRPRTAWTPTSGIRRWAAPPEGTVTHGPAGTPGRVVQRGARATLLSADGRAVRIHSRCACPQDARTARPDVPFEHVHLRRDGAILDVTVGTACGACRAPLP